MRKDDEQHHTAPFRSDEPLLLEPFPNGGWVITQRSNQPGMSGDKIGAYSSATDMLDALKSALPID